MNLFSDSYRNKKILVTGHTGFKGSWLVFWLGQMGAKVYGISDRIPTSPSHFELLNPDMESFFIDVRDKDALQNKIAAIEPDLIFHLAAQSLVRPSYEAPETTFETNVMGTANILGICRFLKNTKGLVNVTSDKCYENAEDDRAYNEQDKMGGYDPYSASKGAAELVANAFRNSYFNVKDFGEKHHFILASARAGNVIGGGDWSQDRLIPDLVRNVGAITAIRNPNATRPWQHVLEPLSGYLLLGQKILSGDISVSGAYNFGPENNESLTVKAILETAAGCWSDLKFEFLTAKNQPHEAGYLRLDCSKANKELNWFPTWTTEKAVSETILWYKNYYQNQHLMTAQHLADYIQNATQKGAVWTK